MAEQNTQRILLNPADQDFDLAESPTLPRCEELELLADELRKGIQSYEGDLQAVEEISGESLCEDHLDSLRGILPKAIDELKGFNEGRAARSFHELSNQAAAELPASYYELRAEMSKVQKELLKRLEAELDDPEDDDISLCTESFTRCADALGSSEVCIAVLDQFASAVRRPWQEGRNEVLSQYHLERMKLVVNRSLAIQLHALYHETDDREFQLAAAQVNAALDCVAALTSGIETVHYDRSPNEKEFINLAALSTETLAMSFQRFSEESRSQEGTEHVLSRAHASHALFFEMASMHCSEFSRFLSDLHGYLEGGKKPGRFVPPFERDLSPVAEGFILAGGSFFTDSNGRAMQSPDETTEQYGESRQVQAGIIRDFETVQLAIRLLSPERGLGKLEEHLLEKFSLED